MGCELQEYQAHFEGFFEIPLFFKIMFTSYCLFLLIFVIL